MHIKRVCGPVYTDCLSICLFEIRKFLGSSKMRNSLNTQSNRKPDGTVFQGNVVRIGGKIDCSFIKKKVILWKYQRGKKCIANKF